MKAKINLKNAFILNMPMTVIDLTYKKQKPAVFSQFKSTNI